MKIRLNKNKNIGSVVFVVEGDVGELDIIKKIFNKIFKYEIVNYDKRKDEIYQFKSPKNKYSKIFVVPAKYSAVSKLDIDDEYFNNIFAKLINYGLDIDNYPIYFLFDRDRVSNRPGAIEENMKKYSNSRDNGLTRNGLFLLSYPSIEAFTCSCYKKDISFSNPKELKFFIIKEDIDINNIDEENILGAGSYLINQIKDIIGKELSINDLDSFSENNLIIFDYQEKRFSREKTYLTLSLLLIACLDLGLIDLIESK